MDYPTMHRRAVRRFRSIVVLEVPQVLEWSAKSTMHGRQSTDMRWIPETRIDIKVRRTEIFVSESADLFQIFDRQVASIRVLSGLRTSLMSSGQESSPTL